MCFRFRLTFAIAFVVLLHLYTAGSTDAASSTSNQDGSARVLILGDSQISFGAGGPYTAFFSSLHKACPGVPAKFRKATAAAVGVRSTSLHHWTATTTAKRRPLCDIDKKYGVNAGAYGITSSDKTFVQIGQNKAYPFCPSGRPALQAALNSQKPDLIVLSFLGNAVERWQSEPAARADWTDTEALIPPDTACLVMTTLPSISAKTNAYRLRAQAHLSQSVQASVRCSFVSGLTPETRKTFEGNARLFRTNSSGRVTDGNHPTTKSTQLFLRLRKPALCAALSRILSD